MWQQLGLVLALAAPGDGPAGRPTEGIEWRRDLAAACAEAKSSRRPLFVVFRCER